MKKGFTLVEMLVVVAVLAIIAAIAVIVNNQNCPQGIEIRKELKNAKKELEGPLFKIASKLLPFFIKY